MKPITLFFAVLLAVAGFGADVLVGRPGGKTNSVPTDVLPDPNASSAPDADKLPAVKLKSRRPPAAAAVPPKPIRGEVIINRTTSAWESQQVQEPCILPNPKDPARLVMF